MVYLLDANILLALGDQNHPHQAAALRFMQSTAIPHGWATCPLTENAYVRIMGRPQPGGNGVTTEDARLSLQSILALSGHEFWPDALSISETRAFPRLPSAGDLTDIYLLALAIRHGGCLATFDANLPATLLPGGPQALHLITP